MKKIISKYLTLLLVLIFCLAATSEKEAPSGLMIEFIRDPGTTRIMDLKPEFSWVVPASTRLQTAFQILVATSKINIDKNTGDAWNSGKVKSDNSSEVEFGGTRLKPDSRYFWKVKIWDQSEKETPFSEAQGFITGKPTRETITCNKFQSPEINPLRFAKITTGHYFADFGKDAFGTLLLKIRTQKNDSVVVHLGEVLSDPLMIDRKPGGSIRYTRVVVPVKKGIENYVVKLPVDARNTGSAAIHLPDSFGIITPFRYCEVENVPGELATTDILQKSYHYYFEEDNSSFTSSDTILNQIWDLCKYSIKATSFAGYYIDGDRERIPYEADAYINLLGHYYTDREYSLARRTNEYFITHPTWPTEWILHTVPMFYYDYMFTGNLESVRTFYDKLREKTLYSIAGDDGLISSKNVSQELMRKLGFKKNEKMRDIVDWPPAQKDTGWKLVNAEGERDGYVMADTSTLVNAFYYRGLVCMSMLAEELGKKEDALNFGRLAVRVKKSFNRRFLSDKTGIYVDGIGTEHSSLHANMTALAFDLVPQKNIKNVTAFIKSRGMACSVYGAQYLMEGLYKAGEADYALDLLTSTSDRSWWNMIRFGSTITMEAWDMKYKPNSDLNHAWGAVPANIIPGYLWGVAPLEPGFAETLIKPQLGKLTQSSINVPTIRGIIKGVYDGRGKSKKYEITVPGNMKCDLELPGVKHVVLNARKTVVRDGFISLNPGENIVILN